MSTEPAEMVASSATRPKTGLAVLGGLVLMASLWKVRFTITSVLGALAALGVEAARNVPQMEAFFHKATVDLMTGVLPGVLSLVLLGYALIGPGTRWVWVLVIALAAALAILPYSYLEHLKAWVESA